jgi:hypothetical protein
MVPSCSSYVPISTKQTHAKKQKKKKKTPLAHTGSKMDHLTNDRRMRRSRSNSKSSNSTSRNNSCLCRASRSFKAESTDEAVQLPSPGKWWPQLLLDKKKFLLVRMFFFVFFLLFLLLLLVASCRCEAWMDQRQACLRDLTLAEDLDLGILKNLTGPRTHLVLVLVVLSQSTATGGSWEAPPASGCHSPLQLRGWGCQNGGVQRA